MCSNQMSTQNQYPHVTGRNHERELVSAARRLTVLVVYGSVACDRATGALISQWIPASRIAKQTAAPMIGKASS